MATIDVSIMIDTDTLIAKYPNPSKDSNNPTAVPHNFMYMVSESQYVKSGQASGDLTINAISGDVIRWRMLSLNGDETVAATIYDIVKLRGSVTGGIEAYESQPYEPKPVLTSDNKNTNPPSFETVTGLDYYLQATVNGHGEEFYGVKFYVTQNLRSSGGKPTLLGYYCWDPTIVVA